MSDVGLPDLTEVHKAARPRRDHGLTPEILFVGGLLCLPAVVMSFYSGNPTVQTLLQRYIILVFALLLISEPLYWMSLGGRTTEPRVFDPDPGHRVPRRSAGGPGDDSANPTMQDESEEDALFREIGFGGREEYDLFGEEPAPAPEPTLADDIFGQTDASDADLAAMFPNADAGPFDDLDDIFGDDVGEDGLTAEQRARRDRGELI